MILFQNISQPLIQNNENLVPQNVPPFVFNAVSRDIENFQEGQIVLLDLPKKTHAADLQHWCTQSNGHGCSQSAFLNRENKITCKLDSLPYRRSSKNVIKKSPLRSPLKANKQTNKTRQQKDFSELFKFSIERVLRLK